MSEQKPTVAIGLLSGCFGCLMSFLDLADDLAEVFNLIEFRRCPFNDVRELEHVTVGMLEGALSTDQDMKLAKEMRENCDVLVSLGTCPSYGGIPGMRNFQDSKTICEDVYGRRVPDDEELPQLLPAVVTLASVVKVDYFIRGCPPTTEKIKETLVAILEGKKVPEKTRNLCVECPRTKESILTPRRGFLTQGVRSVMELDEIDPTRCFLEQGVVCMGLVTVEGCNARCLGDNMPCRGCMGPVPGVPSQGNKLIDAVATLIPSGALMFFEDSVGIAFRYTHAADESMRK